MRLLPVLFGISISKRGSSFTLHNSPVSLFLTRQQPINPTLPSSDRLFTTPIDFHTNNNAGRHHSSNPTPSSLPMSSKDGTTNLDPRALNEFPRPYRTEIVLGARRREFATQITADPTELEGLAKRFSLTRISKLDAAITLKRDQPLRGGGSNGMGDFVQVRGDVIASVTQTCVRTNEDFDIEFEFNLSVMVRACVVQGMEVDLMEEVDGVRSAGNKARKKKKKAKNLGVNGQRLDQMKIREIEDLIQGVDEDMEIVEDLAIMGNDGVLDVGELVAQTFRLKLDPYPKKPGTEPVRYSITG